MFWPVLPALLRDGNFGKFICLDSFFMLTNKLTLVKDIFPTPFPTVSSRLLRAPQTSRGFPVAESKPADEDFVGWSETANTDKARLVSLDTRVSATGDSFGWMLLTLCSQDSDLTKLGILFVLLSVPSTVGCLNNK